MLLPLTVLWVSVTAPLDENPAAEPVVTRGAVAADGALGERQGADGENPAAVGVTARSAVAADGALVKRQGAVGSESRRRGPLSAVVRPPVRVRPSA